MSKNRNMTKLFEIRHIKYILLTGLLLISQNLFSQLNNKEYIAACAKMENGEYEGAVRLFDGILEPNESDINIYFLRGICFSKLNNYESAIENFLKVENHSIGKASLNLAKVYADNNNVIESVKWLRKHLESEYKFPRISILQDSSFMRISESPEWYKLWTESWYTHEEEKLEEFSYLIKRKEANSILRELDDIANLDNARALFLQHLIYLENRQEKKAISNLEKAINLDETNQEYLVSMARLLCDKKNNEKAFYYYDRVVNLYPHNIKIRKEAINQKIKSGFVSDVETEIQFLLLALPDDSEIATCYATLLFKTGRNNEAIDYFSQEITKQGINPSLYKARAGIYHEMRNYSNAISDYSMALDISPRDPDIWYGRGNSRLSNGDSQGACSDWNKAMIYGHREAINMLDKYCYK